MIHERQGGPDCRYARLTFKSTSWLDKHVGQSIYILFYRKIKKKNLGLI